MATNYKPRQLAKDIKTYFENNETSMEVIVLKKGGMIKIYRDAALSKKFIWDFMKAYK